MAGGIFQVDLIRADAETADNDEVLCVAEDAGGELGLGANSYDVNVSARGRAVLVFGFEEVCALR